MRFLIKWILVIMMALALLTGCQQEELIVKLPPAGTTITKADAVTTLVSRVATRDGSTDNILDKSSCVALVFPVTINTNGQTFVINNIDDLDEIEDLFDDSGNDEVEFVFPIRVILADYTEIQIQDEDALDDLLDSCDDDDIECIDFKYPLEFKTYDAQNQVAGTITITSDYALYSFIDQLDDDELVGLVFPVTLILSNGSEIVAEDFDALEDLIKDAEDDCDEDDDNDYNDDDLNEDNLIALLTSGTWRVDLFVDETNQTAEFQNYTFTFLANGTLTALQSGNTSTGNWEIEADDDEMELEIEFENEAVLEKLNQEWHVLEITSLRIKLWADDDDETKTLVLKKL